MAFLSDDILEGREAGTRGHEIAARYIAAQFAIIGVRPGGAAASYFQAVPMLEWSAARRPRRNSRVHHGPPLLQPGGDRHRRGRRIPISSKSSSR